MSDESTTIDTPVFKPEMFGAYELLERLGRGGMADVWRARKAGPSGFLRTVVLKRILPNLISDNRARELFEREARVVSRLSHAHIVQVFEFGEVEGEYYLAMEYIDGHDIAALIRAGVATASAAAFIVRDVGRALAYAYSAPNDDGAPLRILHRDVSPSNIIVGYDGGARLLDFGIAKALSDPRDKRTVKGTIRGKFGYIAPEVIVGLEPDQRADVFAAGVVLHEMLTGKRLFRGANDIETLGLVRHAEIPLPSSMNPRVSPALDAITLRALSRDRDARYSSGDELADALDVVVHELRFGPTQMAELMERLNLKTNQFTPEDSGPRTLQESALPTDRSVELEDALIRSERPTKPMPAEKIAALARESRATNPGYAKGTPVKGAPVQGQTLPAKPRQPSPVGRTPSSAAQPKRSTALRTVLMLLALAALLVSAALVGRRLGLQHRANQSTSP